MELISKKIFAKDITGSTVNFTICLMSEFTNAGYFTDLSTDLTASSGETVSLTGLTENKLKNVRSYDYSNPYVVGINGVTSVSGNQISYTINGINYNTDLSTTALTTSFQLTYLNTGYTVNNLWLEENNISFVDKVSIDNSINIERQNISIIANFSKLRQITSVSEITNFSNGFYQVFDQTI